jgi:hypothetical protein
VSIEGPALGQQNRPAECLQHPTGLGNGCKGAIAMQTISDPARSVKTARFEPAAADRAWAAELFESLDQARYQAEKDRLLEEAYQQARHDDQFNGAYRLPAGLCELCGEPSDWLDKTHKLCCECLTAAENASIACVNGEHGLGYRVF